MSPDEQTRAVEQVGRRMHSVYPYKNKGWRDGSAAESTGCFGKGPRFNSQHPYLVSQPVKSSFRELDALSWSLRIPGMYMLHIHTSKQTLVHIKNV
jgi:hypothetical protein